MILSKSDYRNYVEADRIALGRQSPGLVRKMIGVVSPDYILDFQRLLRRLEYRKNVRNRGVINRLIYLYVRLKYKRLSLRLGFTIPENVFGPGLAIVHYGTIVVNARAKVGANCRIHPGTSIGASGGSEEAPQIGDNVYLAPGARVIGDVKIPNNTAIGANSVVTKSFLEENMMIAGVPAKPIKQIDIKRLIRHL